MKKVAALAICMIALIVVPGTGWAAPVWSGLDARNFAGPIPAPGSLIEAVTLDPELSVPAAASAWRILYAGTDQHDRPAVGTAVVFTPKAPPPSGGWPVLAWAHGTVGLGDDCTPSANPRSERDRAYLSHWLDQGYAVVGADYVGLGTPGLMSYLNARATAHGVVDAVIAAHRMGLPLSPRWAVIGQSQGGGAAVATARWATEFSAGSGLDFRGVVATGTPAGVERLVKSAGPGMTVPGNLAPIANAYTAYILAALAEARPDLGLDAVLTPAARHAVQRAQTVCVHQLADELSEMTVPGFFAAPVGSIPGFDAAVEDFMALPATGYDRPLLLGVGLRDRDVPPELTLRFNDQLVANGQPVQLRVYPDQDHSGTVLASLPDSTPFLARQFAD